MAETIQDFLVSIKYHVDGASQNNFLDMLKRVAGSVGGVAAEITALAGSVVGLAKVLATTGEKFYFMSQRLGSSVNDIQAASYAMSQFGMSAEQASGSIERFGSWTRSMGPAATAYLRSMGVTARDTATQMDQLADVFQRMGGTAAKANGTDAERLQYALTLQRAQMVGLDEAAMLALTNPDRKQDKARAGFIQRTVWGVDTKEEADAAAKKWADQSHQLMRQFREFGLTMDTMRQRFGSALFAQVMPHLERLNAMLLANMPKITEWLEKAATAMGAFLRVLHVGIDTFIKLPGAVQAAIGALLTWRTGLALLKSPLFWILSGLTALMILLDDYQTYMAGGESHLDWGKIAEAFKPIMEALGPIKEIHDAIAGWFDELVHVCGAFDFILITVGAIVGKLLLGKTLGLFGRALGLVGKGAAVTAADAAGAAAAFVGGPALAIIIGAVAAALGIYWGGSIQRKLDKDAEDTGEWEAIPAPPDIGGPSMYRNKKDPSRVISSGAMAKILGQTWYGGEEGADVNEHQGPGLLERAGKAIGDFWSRISGTDPQEGKARPVSINDQDAQKIGLGIVQGMGRYASNSANMFAGPGVPGDPNFGVNQPGSPAGGGWAGRALVAQAGGGGGGASGGAGDADAGAGGDASTLGLSPEQYDAWRSAVGQRESGGRYGIMGGSSGRFAGKYQFGAAEIAETARALGEPVPTRQQFLSDPAMQERYFLRYTIGHHRTLMRNQRYAAMSPAERAGMLMAAHLKGAGAAQRMLQGGSGGRDAFGTSASSYYNIGKNAVQTAPLGHGPGGAAFGGRGGGAPVQHNNTTVNVAPGPNAEATAHRVADAQSRVNERQVRLFQGALA